MREKAIRIEVGDDVIHFRAWDERGADLPPIVLVHGFIISSRYLVPLARQLAQGFTVYAPDLPGFGKSTKPRRALSIDELADALARWMDAAGLPEAILAGNSMGCQVLAAFAQRHPRRVLRLVLVGPTTDARARTVPRHAWRLFRDMLRERPSLPFLHVPDYVRTGPRLVLQTLRHTLADAIEARMPDVEAPTLIVRGDRDVLVPQAWAEHLARLLPRGELEILPRSPHAGNYSAPQGLARLMLPFLLREQAVAGSAAG